jgi:tetratricopeptide (TPR) repeat protein
MEEGHFRQALHMFDEAEKESMASHNTEGGIEALYWKGRSYAATGSYHEARQFFDRALISAGKGSPLEKDLLFHRALVTMQETTPKEALHDFEKALALPERVPGQNALILLHYGEACRALGEYNRGYHLIERGLKEKGVTPFQAVLLRCTMADCHLSLGQPQRALQTYQQALAAAEKNLRDPWLRGMLYFHMGAFYDTQALDEEAVRYYKKATEARIEAASITLPEEEDLCDDLDIPLYEVLIGTLLKQGYDKEGLYYCLQAREREVRKKSIFMTGSFQAMLPLMRKKRHARTGEEAEEATRKLEALEKESPPSPLSMLPLKGGEAPLQAGEDTWYQELLFALEESALRLEYYTGRDRTFLWTLDGAHLKSFIIGEGEKKLRSRLQELRKGTKDRPKKLAEMGALLCLPGKESLAGKDKLLLGVHGILLSLPFDAFPDGSGATLLDRVEISCTGYSQEKIKEKKMRPLLVLCEPGGGESGALQKTEIDMLASSYSPRILVKNRQLTKERLAHAFDEASLGHFASRWSLGVPWPDCCGTVVEDGFCSLADFSTAGTPGLCLVISRQERIKEEELSPAIPLYYSSLSRKGTKTMVTATWNVPADEKIVLLGLFYGGIKEGFAPAAALRSARLRTKLRFPESNGWEWFILIQEGTSQ